MQRYLVSSLASGGRSKRYRAPSAHRRAYAPRWTPAAAMAASQALDAVASQGLADFLRNAAVDDRLRSLWRACLRRVRVEEHDRAVARCVIFTHLDQMAAWPAMAERVLHRLLRCLRKRTADMRRVRVTPPLQQRPLCLSPHELRLLGQALPVGPARAPRALSSELEASLQRWHLRPGMAGVVAPARARARVELERGGSLSLPRDLRFRDALVHASVLPTLTASDHYFDLESWRWWSPREIAGAFGVPPSSALARSLAGAERYGTQKQLVAAFGRSVCVPAIKVAICRVLVATLAPPADGGTRALRYGSLFSGLDLAAVALEALLAAGPDDPRSGALRGLDLRYVFAAERDGGLRAHLARTWAACGLVEEHIYEDACSLPRGAVPDVDLLVATPECCDFSRCRRGRSRAAQAQSLQDASNALEYVRWQAPRAVVIENVDEPGVVPFMDDMVGRMTAYHWERVTLDPAVHLGWPMSRRRAFWLGMRLDAIRPGFLSESPYLRI